MIKPGLFTKMAYADTRRDEFDSKNEVLLEMKCSVDLLFIGDSITHNFETEAFFCDKGRVINRGIGGDTAYYLTKRFEADALQLKPKQIILHIGINDTWVLDDEGESYQDESEIEQSILESLTIILNQCRLYDQMIIVANLLPTRIQTNQNNERRNKMILSINKKIEKVVQAYGQRYVDYHGAFVTSNGESLLDELANDGLHPNAAGYNRIINLLNEIL